MIEIALHVATGFFLGVSLASAIYARKFRKISRDYRHLKDEIDAVRTAVTSGQFMVVDFAGRADHLGPPRDTQTKH